MVASVELELRRDAPRALIAPEERIAVAIAVGDVAGIGTAFVAFASAFKRGAARRPYKPQAHCAIIFLVPGMDGKASLG
eukprot:scaffold2528_cov134-Pinguiococcus_pyrenoidosus.AAC.1